MPLPYRARAVGGHAPPVREAAVVPPIRCAAPFPLLRRPDVSLRGAKRRGNLAVPGRTTGKPSAKSQLPPRDCTPRALPRASRSGRHVGLRPPRNDKSGGYYRFIVNLFGSAVQRREGTARPLQGACGRRGRSVILGCAWRSLSAATDAIGACRFNGTLFQSFVQRRERHAAPLQGACGRRACPARPRSGSSTANSVRCTVPIAAPP